MIRKNDKIRQLAKKKRNLKISGATVHITVGVKFGYKLKESQFSNQAKWGENPEAPKACSSIY